MAEPTLSELETAVKNATADYVEKLQIKDDAYRDASEARETLNKAQRALDIRMDELRAQAPRDTQWKTQPSLRITDLARIDAE